MSVQAWGHTGGPWPKGREERWSKLRWGGPDKRQPGKGERESSEQSKQPQQRPRCERKGRFRASRVSRVETELSAIMAHHTGWSLHCVFKAFPLETGQGLTLSLLSAHGLFSTRSSSRAPAWLVGRGEGQVGPTRGVPHLGGPGMDRNQEEGLSCREICKSQRDQNVHPIFLLNFPNITRYSY